MPANKVKNKITILNLESVAKELKEKNKTEEEIAAILSNRANQKISRSSVHRFFAEQIRTHQEVIEKNDKLKAKVIEAELDTVQQRHEIITELRELAVKAKEENDITAAIVGLHRAIIALDSLDKRLGRFISGSGIQVNVNQTNQSIHVQEYIELKSIVVNELCDNCKEKVRLRLHELVTSNSQ